VILAGRRINDRVGAHVAESVVKLMLREGIRVCRSRVLVLGLAFKENCPDIRNTRLIDIIRSLRDYAIEVDCYDPWIDRADAKDEYGLDCLPDPPEPGTYDALILAVAHREFVELGEAGLRRFGKSPSVLYDVKSVLPKSAVDARL
jgi:UDP-N-acetyl-D-galactosamine dehydrogenase